MPYNFAADSFHTKKLRSRRNAILHGNRLFCVFETLFEGLRSNVYDNHLRLIVKRVVDLTLIELFSLGVTAERLRANIS